MATVTISEPKVIMSLTRVCTRPQTSRPQSPSHYARQRPTEPDADKDNSDRSGGEKLSIEDFFNLMKYERLRLITYILYGHQWPKTDVISPSALANAGFFYLKDDQVQCAFCRGKISNWNFGNDAMSEHRQHFPKCLFANGKFVGNISLELDPDINSNTDFNPYRDDNPGPEPIKVNYNKGPNPKFPALRDVATRSATFRLKGWQCKIDRKLFIQAGFFYTGKNDCTRCYHCGGVLFNWKPHEIPMEEHATFFPECPFVLETKGPNYLMFVRFKREIIEMRSQMDTSVTSKAQDIECIRKITFENFQMMNQAAKKILTRLGETANEERIHSSCYYEEYMQKQLFFLDCQKLFHYLLHGLGVMSRPGDLAPLATAAAPGQSHDSDDDDETSSGAQSVHSNPSVFSLADTPASDSDYSSCNSDSDHDGGGKSPAILATNANGDGNESSQEKSQESSLSCSICYDKQIQVVFVPCGHQLACMNCALPLNRCPICRQTITSKIRTYFASVPN